MITIDNFESKVPIQIRQRGQTYYSLGHVFNLEEVETGEWTANVEGMDDYKVSVSLDGDEVVDWSCDCPYDGDMCKHVVAVLLAIRKKIRQSTFIQMPKSTARRAEGRDADFRKKLMLVTKEELSDFVCRYADAHKDFKDSVLRDLIRTKTTGDKSAQNYRTEVEKAFSKFRRNKSSHYGRYHYTEMDWEGAVPVLDKYLEKASVLLGDGCASAAASIASTVLDCIGKEYGDAEMYDEDLYLTDTCEAAGDILLKVVMRGDFPDVEKKKLLAELRDIEKHSAYSDYDVYDIEDLLQDMEPFVLSSQEVLKNIDAQLKKNKGSWDEYKWVLRKIESLQGMGQKEEADKVVEQYLHLPEIRQRKLDTLLAKPDYAAAIQLLDEGIRQSKEEQKYGITSRWKEEKLKIYEKINDVSACISICREVFIDKRGSMDYYRKLKTLVAADEWKTFLANLLKEASVNDRYSGWGGNLLADIYVEEKDWQSLCAWLIRQDYDLVQVLTRYAPYLKDDYSPLLIDAFKDCLRTYAAKNVGQKYYDVMASALKSMKKLKGGQATVSALVDEFCLAYKRRSSMVATLRRV